MFHVLLAAEYLMCGNHYVPRVSYLQNASQVHSGRMAAGRPESAFYKFIKKGGYHD